MNGHIDVIRYLVSQGADIHAHDDLAVRWASENGHLDGVNYLVETGNYKTNYNYLIFSSILLSCLLFLR